MPQESLYEQKKLHLIIQESWHVIVMVIARIIPVNAECEVFGIRYSVTKRAIRYAGDSGSGGSTSLKVK